MELNVNIGRTLDSIVLSTCDMSHLTLLKTPTKVVPQQVATSLQILCFERSKGGYFKGKTKVGLSWLAGRMQLLGFCHSLCSCQWRYIYIQLLLLLFVDEEVFKERKKISRKNIEDFRVKGFKLNRGHCRGEDLKEHIIWCQWWDAWTLRSTGREGTITQYILHILCIKEG